MILALTIALLIGCSVYLVLQRGLVRVVLGMMCFGHGVNLTILATGVYSYRAESFPSANPIEEMADPLPQAFVLTAVVISMATATILLTLAAMGPNDDTDVVEAVDDNTIDHTFSTLGRDAQNKDIRRRSERAVQRIEQARREHEEFQAARKKESAEVSKAQPEGGQQ
jgi:multicomponent Na+:H+ antiporter subunit C